MGTSTFHTRPGQRFLAFALVAALYVCTSATAAVEASEPNPADEHQLLVKLETMRVKEPTAVPSPPCTYSVWSTTTTLRS